MANRNNLFDINILIRTKRDASTESLSFTSFAGLYFYRKINRHFDEPFTILKLILT